MADKTKEAPDRSDKKKFHHNYVPFRYSLFQNKKEQYPDMNKWGNMGVAVGLKWRKGYPVQKLGKYAGTFRSSGHKNKVYATRAFRKMKNRTKTQRVEYNSIYKTQYDHSKQKDN